MIISGAVHDVDVQKRLISIRFKKHLHYFYLQNNLMKKFKKYIYPGRFVQFSAEDLKKNIRGVNAYRVDYFIKIIRQRYIGQETYYDIDIIRSGISELMNGLNNIMFLDLEMTMHDFDVSPFFESEIIQAGFIICDKNGETLLKESNYVKPTKFKHISKRTKTFLNITNEDLEGGLEYRDFYKHFKEILKKYNPTIMVWGRNDIIILKNSYILNDLPSLNEDYCFINLLQIQKNYFNLKNDLGLFNALTIYTGTDNRQVHDALDDALVTKEVFFAFKDILNNKPDFVFPNIEVLK